MPDEQMAKGMLDVLQLVPSNSWTPMVLSARRPKAVSIPGDDETTAPVLGSAAAKVFGGGGAGGVRPYAGACSAVALSTASAVVHAYSATVYGGAHVTSRH